MDEGSVARVNPHLVGNPVEYLEARARVACDAQGNRGATNWNSADIAAVHQLADDGRLYPLPLYETLTRSVAVRDGLL